MCQLKLNYSDSESYIDVKVNITMGPGDEIIVTWGPEGYSNMVSSSRYIEEKIYRLMYDN